VRNTVVRAILQAPLAAIRGSTSKERGTEGGKRREGEGEGRGREGKGKGGGNLLQGLLEG